MLNLHVSSWSASALLFYAFRARCQRAAFSLYWDLINDDAGEASRCQTCSAPRQQQVHRLGKKHQSVGFIQTHSSFQTVMSNASLWRDWCMREIGLFICPHPEEAEVEVSGSVSWQWFNILLRMTSYPGSSKCSDCVSLKGPQNSPTFFLQNTSVKENQTHADSDDYKSERVEDKPISLTSCPFVPGSAAQTLQSFCFLETVKVENRGEGHIHQSKNDKDFMGPYERVSPFVHVWNSFSLFVE